MLINSKQGHWSLSTVYIVELGGFDKNARQHLSERFVIVDVQIKILDSSLQPGAPRMAKLTAVESTENPLIPGIGVAIYCEEKKASSKALDFVKLCVDQRQQRYDLQRQHERTLEGIREARDKADATLLERQADEEKALEAKQFQQLDKFARK